MSFRVLFLAAWLFSLGVLFFSLPSVSERNPSPCGGAIHEDMLLREVGCDILESLLFARDGLPVRYPVLLALAAHMERTGGGELSHVEIHPAKHLPTPLPVATGDFLTCEKKLLLKSRKAYTIFVTYSPRGLGGPGQPTLLTEGYSFR